MTKSQIHRSILLLLFTSIVKYCILYKKKCLERNILFNQSKKVLIKMIYSVGLLVRGEIFKVEGVLKTKFITVYV